MEEQIGFFKGSHLAEDEKGGWVQLATGNQQLAKKREELRVGGLASGVWGCDNRQQIIFFDRTGREPAERISRYTIRGNPCIPAEKQWVCCSF
jgi:hypothetical protein